MRRLGRTVLGWLARVFRPQPPPVLDGYRVSLAERDLEKWQAIQDVARDCSRSITDRERGRL